MVATLTNAYAANNFFNVEAFETAYKLSNESFVQIGDKYYFTVLIEEMDATKNVVLSYRVKLCISIVNDAFILNSIIVY